MKIWICELCRAMGKRHEVTRSLTGYSELAEHYKREHPGQAVKYRATV